MLTLTLNASAADKKLLSLATIKKINAHLSKHLKLEKKSFEASLAFVSAPAIQSLNHDFRGLQKPTNVLSFPQFTPAELKKLRASKITKKRRHSGNSHRQFIGDVNNPESRAIKTETIYLGDIVLCKKIIVSETLKLKKPLNHHLIHLVVHGTLHLLGYDHMGNAEAKRMETLETRILATLGISDPYGIERPKIRTK